MLSHWFHKRRFLWALKRQREDVAIRLLPHVDLENLKENQPYPGWIIPKAIRAHMYGLAKELIEAFSEHEGNNAWVDRIGFGFPSWMAEQYERARDLFPHDPERQKQHRAQIASVILRLEREGLDLDGPYCRFRNSTFWEDQFEQSLREYLTGLDPMWFAQGKSLYLNEKLEDKEMENVPPRRRL